MEREGIGYLKRGLQSKKKSLQSRLYFIDLVDWMLTQPERQSGRGRYP